MSETQHDYVSWPSGEKGEQLEMQWLSSGIDESLAKLQLGFKTPVTWLDLEAFRRRTLNTGQ